MKSGKSGIQAQLDALKTKIERDQTELKAKRGKITYRSVDEIDRDIKYPPSPHTSPLHLNILTFLVQNPRGRSRLWQTQTRRRKKEPQTHHRPKIPPQTTLRLLHPRRLHQIRHPKT